MLYALIPAFPGSLRATLDVLPETMQLHGKRWRKQEACCWSRWYIYICIYTHTYKQYCL